MGDGDDIEVDHTQGEPVPVQIEVLRARTQRLDERIGDIDRKTTLIIGSLRALISAGDVDDDADPLIEMRDRAEEFGTELEDLQSAVSHHGEQLEAVANVGQKKTDKEGKVAAIAAFAMQKADASQSKVLVKSGEIRGCVGVTRRYSYDLIDDIGGLDENGDGGGFDDGDYQWAAVREEKTVPTGTGTERKPKALKVDCDRLRKSSHAPESVNKFTTRTGGEGR